MKSEIEEVLDQRREEIIYLCNRNNKKYLIFLQQKVPYSSQIIYSFLP